MNGLMTLPMLIFVFGLPGSGKSFFASQLATLLKMEYLNSDKVRMKMLSKRTYSDDEKRKVYENMLLKMDRLLRRGKHVVLDATFYTKEIRSMFLNKAEGKANVFFIEVRADESLIHQRLEKSRKDTEADFSVYEKIKALWEPLEEDHLVLHSTNDNILDMLRQANTYLKRYDNLRNQ